MLKSDDRELLEGHRAVLERVLEKLDSLPSGLRQTLADHLWASIPETVMEYGFSPSALTVTAKAQTAGLRRITGIYTFSPDNQTGYVQLGNTLIIPVPSGAYYLGPGASFLLDSGDQKTLTVGTPGGTGGTPGPICLILFGQQLPRWGQLD